jgi:hypothetical protein
MRRRKLLYEIIREWRMDRRQCGVAGEGIGKESIAGQSFKFSSFSSKNFLFPG